MKRFALFATVLISVMTILGFGLSVSALDPIDDVCNQAGSSSQVCQSPDSNPLFGPSGIITTATQVIALAVGVAAVFVIIIAGFKYVTSAGDSNSINSAKNTILYAVVGLVVAVLAQAIVLFVLKRL